MRVPASADPTACARGLPGSKPRWCSARGQQRIRRTATCKRNFTESKPAAVRRRLSWPSPPPSSRPSTTCLRMGRCITTSVANTLTTAPMTSKNEVWSNASLTLATPWRSNPSLPKPYLWHGRELVAWSVRGSFFLVPHRRTADPRCMKLCYRVSASSA